ncbi:MAG: Jag N-terminal domain-containing protein [Candidatus Babeliales bacterium]|jgi:predicted RNA-binding protein Jag
MKSMLHEAATVAKAIEKAWADSGKPSEFTIKIHEMGEKNFLGFNKRPAIVSIIYDPRSQVASFGDKKVVQPQQRQERYQQQGPRERGDQRRKPQPVEKRQPMVTRSVQEILPPQVEAWTSELVTDIEQWLKEIMGIMDIRVAYATRVDRRALYVIFERGIFPTVDEDRQLFAGLSHLLVQFLKKKHKKKLRGYHLVLSAKDYAAPSGSTTPSSH